MSKEWEVIALHKRLLKTFLVICLLVVGLFLFIGFIPILETYQANAAVQIDKWNKYAVDTTVKESDWVVDRSFKYTYGAIPSYGAYYIDKVNGKYVVQEFTYLPVSYPYGKMITYDVATEPGEPANRILYRYTAFYGESNNFVSQVTLEYKKITDVKYKTKGALLQENIEAPAGTYPDDGIHTDGFWYVKTGSVPNNPPIGTVNQTNQKPISSQQTFSITGTASDPDGDTLLIQATIGGVTKQTSLTNTQTTKNWTLTWNKDEIPDGVYTNISVTISDGK